MYVSMFVCMYVCMNVCMYACVGGAAVKLRWWVVSRIAYSKDISFFGIYLLGNDFLWFVYSNGDIVLILTMCDRTRREDIQNGNGCFEREDTANTRRLCDWLVDSNTIIA